MAQVLFTGVKLFCGMPGHEILGPLIMIVNPISPINLICFAGWLLGVRYSKLLANLGKGSWKESAKWAAMFYAVTMFLVYILLFTIMCGASKRARAF